MESDPNERPLLHDADETAFARWQLRFSAVAAAQKWDHPHAIQEARACLRGEARKAILEGEAAERHPVQNIYGVMGSWAVLLERVTNQKARKEARDILTARYGWRHRETIERTLRNLEGRCQESSREENHRNQQRMTHASSSSSTRWSNQSSRNSGRREEKRPRRDPLSIISREEAAPTVRSVIQKVEPATSPTPGPVSWAVPKPRLGSIGKDMARMRATTTSSSSGEDQEQEEEDAGQGMQLGLQVTPGLEVDSMMGDLAATEIRRASEEAADVEVQEHLKVEAFLPDMQEVNRLLDEEAAGGNLVDRAILPGEEDHHLQELLDAARAVEGRNSTDRHRQTVDQRLQEAAATALEDFDVELLVGAIHGGESVLPDQVVQAQEVDIAAIVASLTPEERPAHSISPTTSDEGGLLPMAQVNIGNGEEEANNAGGRARADDGVFIARGKSKADVKFDFDRRCRRREEQQRMKLADKQRQKREERLEQERNDQRRQRRRATTPSPPRRERGTTTSGKQHREELREKLKERAPKLFTPDQACSLPRIPRVTDNSS